MSETSKPSSSTLRLWGVIVPQRGEILTLNVDQVLVDFFEWKGGEIDLKQIEEIRGRRGDFAVPVRFLGSDLAPKNLQVRLKDGRVMIPSNIDVRYRVVSEEAVRIYGEELLEDPETRPTSFLIGKVQPLQPITISVPFELFAEFELVSKKVKIHPNIMSDRMKNWAHLSKGPFHETGKRRLPIREM